MVFQSPAPTCFYQKDTTGWKPKETQNFSIFQDTVDGCELRISSWQLLRDPMTYGVSEVSNSSQLVQDFFYPLYFDVFRIIWHFVSEFEIETTLQGESGWPCRCVLLVKELTCSIFWHFGWKVAIREWNRRAIGLQWLMDSEVSFTHHALEKPCFWYIWSIPRFFHESWIRFRHVMVWMKQPSSNLWH